jgi:Lon protease-like protein
MFDHALQNGRYIGMIQPSEEPKKNGEMKPPSLYNIGCAGFLTAFSQTNDNRYEIILEGVCRFKIKKELEIMNGFRRANVQWSKFKSDFKIEKLNSNEKREEFLKILRPFLEKMSMNVDWDVIEGTNDEDLINTISMCCPFDVNEKQALLEAISLENRREVLTSLIHINLNKNNMGSRYVS